jgi:glutathione synthase/RimK-type ligase-like ATP-grasp enzyme
MTVYFATNSQNPDLTADDRMLFDAVQGMCIDSRILDWHDTRVRPDIGDLVVIRSCWDYHLCFDEFRAWLSQLEAAGAVVANTSRTVLDTLDKRYLLALRDAGVARIPSTIVVPQGSGLALDLLLDEMGSQGLVVKPLVSLSAYNTIRVSPVPTSEQKVRVQELSRESDLLVQPFLPEICTAGELSLVFVGGRFSHAVRKRPAEGDFRVQTEFGGEVQAVDVDSDIVSEALCCLDGLTTTSMYARVDGVMVDGRFTLMEVELIDPVLYLGMHPSATGLLAGEIARMAFVTNPTHS